FFFFQAEDGIRDRNVTGVQTCALPISPATTYLNDSSLLIIGSMLYNVPVPVPRVISLIDNVQNIIRNNREDPIINTFVPAAIFTPLVFISVTIINKDKIHIDGGTSGIAALKKIPNSK